MGALEFLKKNQKTIIFSAVLIFIFILVYGPHFNYKYPLHADEWVRLGDSRRFLEGEETYGSAHEEGFQIFLSFLTLIGFNLILLYRFFPAVFALISSIALFLLIKRKTKSFYAGILAMLFFALLPSNPYILGLWYFTPLTFVMPLVYLFVLLFTEGIEQENIKKIAYSFVIALLILLTHPVSITFMIPILIIYMLFNLEFLKKYWKMLSLLCIIPLLSLIWTFIIYWKGSFIKTLTSLLAGLKFGFGNYLPIDEFVYFFPILYGWLATLLAFVGIFFALRKKNMKIFIIWILVTFFFMSIVTRFSFSLFASYQRMVYYTMIGLTPLTAFGLYKLLEKGFFYFKNKKIAFIVIAIVLILVFSIHINKYTKLASDANFYYDIDDDDFYKTLLFLEKFDKTTVMCHIKNSLSIQPVSGHIPVSCMYGLCLKTDENAIDNLKFFNKNTSCSAKEELLKKYSVGFVLSDDEIDCSWKKIFENTKYVYDVRELEE